MIDLSGVIDLLMCAACAVGLVCFLKKVPLPDRSYGGPMSQSTYFAPFAAFALYKTLFWCIGVRADVSFFLHIMVSFVVGSLLMFFSLALDPDQCGPGVFLAFLWGSLCSLTIPLLTHLMTPPPTSLLLTQALVPTALASCWVMGRLMHSD